MGLLRKRLTVCLAAILLALALFEGILRAVGYYYVPFALQVGGAVQDWRTEHTFDDPRFVADSKLIWRPKPGYSVFNSQGLRGRVLSSKKSDAEWRIIAIGDSNTLGWDINVYPQYHCANWPEYLEPLLESPGTARVTVTNAGVWGYSSFQGAQLIKRILTYNPDLVLVSYGSNDALQVAVPDDRFSTAAFGTSWGELRLVQLGKAALDRFREAAAARQGRAVARVSVAGYRENLCSIIHACRERGARCMLLTRPFIGASPGAWCWKTYAPDYVAATLDVGKEEGVPVVDVYAAFKDKPSLFADESHFTEEGHHKAAELIAEAIRRVRDGEIDTDGKEVESPAATQSQPPAAPLGLFAAPPPVDARSTLLIGQTLTTGPETLRAMMEDGTPVYLNRQTTLAHDCGGELTLRRGEICVEVQGPPAALARGKRAEVVPPGMVVNLPQGELTARRAIVDLRLDGDGLRAAVIRGMAYLNDEPIAAGQSLECRGKKGAHGVKPVNDARPLTAIAWTCTRPLEGGSGDAAAAAPRPHDLIFLVECSGDRAPAVARTQIEIVRRLVAFADDGARVALVAAGPRPQVLTLQKIDAAGQMTRSMEDLLEHTRLLGGLNLGAAIEAAKPLVNGADNPLLVHIGAGRAAVGQCDPAALLKNLPPGVRYVGFPVTTALSPLEVQSRVVAFLDSLDRAAPQVNLIAHPLAPRGESLAAALVNALAESLPRVPRYSRQLPRVSDCWQLALAGRDWREGRLAEAERRIARLQASPRAARSLPLWRAAAVIAGSRGHYYRAIECWEKALNVSGTGYPLAGGVPMAGGTRSVPDTLMPDTSPNDYRWLLNEYGKLAAANRGLASSGAAALADRVVRAADRWRLLDPVSRDPCRAAARVLADLGAADEAALYAATLPSSRGTAADRNLFRWIAPLFGEATAEGRPE